MGSLGGSVVKNPPATQKTYLKETYSGGSIPRSGRSPGEGNVNPLQYSCLGIPWTDEPGGLQFMGSLKSHTTQRLNNNNKQVQVNKAQKKWQPCWLNTQKLVFRTDRAARTRGQNHRENRTWTLGTYSSQIIDPIIRCIMQRKTLRYPMGQG